jgi:nitrite reductase (NADH) small subunit
MSTYRIGPLSQIPVGEGREFKVDGIEIAVFHARNGKVYASQARCPHLNGPLADGILGGSIIMCPLHARKYDLANGMSQQGDCGIETYAVEVTSSEQIIVTVNEAAATAV